MQKSLKIARQRRVCSIDSEQFTKPFYAVDILKVEVPVNSSFVAGTRAFSGQRAFENAYKVPMRIFPGVYYTTKTLLISV